MSDCVQESYGFGGPMTVGFCSPIELCVDPERLLDLQSPSKFLNQIGLLRRFMLPLQPIHFLGHLQAFPGSLSSSWIIDDWKLMICISLNTAKDYYKGIVQVSLFKISGLQSLKKNDN